MARKILLVLAVVAMAMTPLAGFGTAEAQGHHFGGGFHGGGFHGGFRGGFRGGFGGVYLGYPYFGAYPYAYGYPYAAPPALAYFCPPANGYYPAVPSCPVPWQTVYQ